jgi:hypothetical protein
MIVLVRLQADRVDQRATPGRNPLAPVPSIHRLYAAATTSDYVARVAPLVRACVPDIGDLLDVGAGGGQLGCALRAPGRAWTAIEPSSNMRARLARLDVPPRLISGGWEAANVQAAAHDTVLAANIAAPLQEPSAFLRRCLAWARHTMVWVVPAQDWPRGLCFARLPSSERCMEDGTPGIDVVLRALAPSRTAFGRWRNGRSPASSPMSRAANYLATGEWPAAGRRPETTAHLAEQAEAQTVAGTGSKFKRSAVLSGDVAKGASMRRLSCVRSEWALRCFRPQRGFSPASAQVDLGEVVITRAAVRNAQSHDRHGPGSLDASSGDQDAESSRTGGQPSPEPRRPSSRRPAAPSHPVNSWAL